MCLIICLQPCLVQISEKHVSTKIFMQILDQIEKQNQKTNYFIKCLIPNIYQIEQISIVQKLK